MPPEITARHLLEQIDALRATVLNLIAQFKPGDELFCPSIAGIKKRVADRLGVSVAWIDSKDRHAEIAHARHIAMYLCRFPTKPITTAPAHSLTVIGKAFNRDHGTVMNAIKRIEFEMRKPEFARVIAELQNQPEGKI